MSSNIPIEWPGAFVAVAQYMTILKLDLLGILGMGCLTPMHYYIQDLPSPCPLTFLSLPPPHPLRRRRLHRAPHPLAWH